MDTPQLLRDVIVEQVASACDEKWCICKSSQEVSHNGNDPQERCTVPRKYFDLTMIKIRDIIPSPRALQSKPMFSFLGSKLEPDKPFIVDYESRFLLCLLLAVFRPSYDWCHWPVNYLANDLLLFQPLDFVWLHCVH